MEALEGAVIMRNTVGTEDGLICYLQYFIIKVLSILNDEQLSIAIQNTAKFRMQGNLYCGEGSHLRDREAVRLRDSIYLHFALTDWKQAGFPETWLWKHPRGSLMRLGPSNFPQKCIFTLSALWMCRAVAFCKHSRKEVAQKSWPSFPHPWTQWKHTLLQATQFLSLVPASTSSPHPRVFVFFLPTLPPWMNPCRPAGYNFRRIHRNVEIILGKSYFWRQ